MLLRARLGRPLAAWMVTTLVAPSPQLRHRHARRCESPAPLSLSLSLSFSLSLSLYIYVYISLSLSLSLSRWCSTAVSSGHAIFSGATQAGKGCVQQQRATPLLCGCACGVCACLCYYLLEAALIKFTPVPVLLCLFVSLPFGGCSNQTQACACGVCACLCRFC